MARIFRIWEKKRGARRTGSQTVGRVGESLFFAVLFLLGSVSLAALLTSQAVDPDPRLYSFGYGFYLMLIVLTSFILIGGGGLVYAVLEAGASAERRSALARRAASIDLIREARTVPENFPCIPSDANLTNSPGIQLAFRLPSMESPVWRLSVAAVFCSLWSIVSGVLIVVAINSYRAGRPQWLLTLFVGPFLGSGLWAVHYFFRQLLIHTVIGPTSVEISEHPLFPGRQYDLFLSQGGRLQMRQLEVWLICLEEATFRQGTDIRSEQHVVLREPIAIHKNFRIEPGRPFEDQCQLPIPDDAMHSFVTRNNAIHWRLVVRGEAELWPPFERSFPIVVYPHAAADKEAG